MEWIAYGTETQKLEQLQQNEDSPPY